MKISSKSLQENTKITETSIYNNKSCEHHCVHYVMVVTDEEQHIRHINYYFYFEIIKNYINIEYDSLLLFLFLGSRRWVEKIWSGPLVY